MSAWFLMWSLCVVGSMLWIDRRFMTAQVEKGVVKAVMKPKLRMKQQLTRQRVAKSGEDEMPGFARSFSHLFIFFMKQTWEIYRGYFI